MPEAKKGEGESAILHARSFLDGIKNGTPTTCPVETGHRSTSRSASTTVRPVSSPGAT